MRHLNKGKKFGREIDQRRAFLKSLGANLVINEKITTTLTRAKELKRFIEKKISLVEDNKLNSIRNLRRFFSEETAKKLLKMAEKFKKRKGGWTRIIKLGARKSDGAEMAKIEIIK